MASIMGKSRYLVGRTIKKVRVDVGTPSGQAGRYVERYQVTLKYTDGKEVKVVSESGLAKLTAEKIWKII